MVVCRRWLARRQMAHVLAHRAAVPEQFSGRIELSAHQKAADYTVAQTRFGGISLAIEVTVLLSFTFGGGLQFLHQFGMPESTDCPMASPDFQRHGHLGADRSAAGLVPAVCHRTKIRLQLHDTQAVRRRPRQTDRAWARHRHAVAVSGVLWLMARMGNLWWLYVWLFWCAFNLLLLFVYPNWIAPLFNKFWCCSKTPRSRHASKDLLRRCGFNSAGLWVMDVPGVRITVTPISPALARPSASSFSTPCSPACNRPRSKRYSPTSSDTSPTAT